MLTNLAGKQFGRLRVLHRGKNHPRHSYWRVRCECGVEKDVRADGLRRGAVLSCGCLHREISSAFGHHYKPGTRFGRLTILREAGSITKRGTLYFCGCDCGEAVIVQGRHLSSGETRSCGCWYKDTRKTSNRKHGQCPVHDKTPVYSAYQRQKGLCRNPRARNFNYYGGRGIEFHFENFPQFFGEVGPKPSDSHWLMRRNSDGHFEAGNLEWVLKRPRRKRTRK